MGFAHHCPYRADDRGLVVSVRLTPGSSRDAIEGEDRHGGRPVIKARVRARPEKGRANAALEQLFATWLGVPRSTVAVVNGRAARNKTLAVAGDSGLLGTAVDLRLGKAPGRPDGERGDH